MVDTVFDNPQSENQDRKRYDWSALKEDSLYGEILDTLDQIAKRSGKKWISPNRREITPSWQPEGYKEGHEYRCLGLTVKAAPSREPATRDERYERQDIQRIMNRSGGQFAPNEGDLLGNIHFNPFGTMWRPGAREGEPDSGLSQPAEIAAVMLAWYVSLVDYFSQGEVEPAQFFYGKTNHFMGKFRERFGFTLQPEQSEGGRGLSFPNMPNEEERMYEFFATAEDVQASIYKMGEKRSLLKKLLGQAQSAVFV